MLGDNATLLVQDPSMATAKSAYDILLYLKFPRNLYFTS